MVKVTDPVNIKPIFLFEIQVQHASLSDINNAFISLPSILYKYIEILKRLNPNQTLHYINNYPKKL